MVPGGWRQSVVDANMEEETSGVLIPVADESMSILAVGGPLEIVSPQNSSK